MGIKGGLAGKTFRDHEPAWHRVVRRHFERKASVLLAGQRDMLGQGGPDSLQPICGYINKSRDRG